MLLKNLIKSQYFPIDKYIQKWIIVIPEMVTLVDKRWLDTYVIYLKNWNIDKNIKLEGT